MRYYVYIHKDLNDNVFYVGKGTGNRCYVKCNKRSAAWKERSRGGFTYAIIQYNLTEDQALELETALILKPMKNWDLINKTISTKIKLIAFEEINKEVYYDETSPSGLRWKTSKRGVTKGSPAGSLKLHQNGMAHKWVVAINRKYYCVHRLIYLLNNPEYDQTKIINHIDFNPANNKILNLELVTKTENNNKIAATNNIRLKANNTSGFTGVSEDDNYYVAFYSKDGKLKRKFFSKIKLGRDRAFNLAKQWREIHVKKRN